MRYSNTALLVALALALGTASGSNCLWNCNNTLSACEWNTIVDKEVCSQGMEGCVLRCFNQSSISSSPTYPQNCTQNIEFLQYLDNSTSKRIMNNCMWKAFQPK